MYNDIIGKEIPNIDPSDLDFLNEAMIEFEDDLYANDLLPDHPCISVGSGDDVSEEFQETISDYPEHEIRAVTNPATGNTFSILFHVE